MIQKVETTEDVIKLANKFRAGFARPFVRNGTIAYDSWGKKEDKLIKDILEVLK